MIDRMETFPQNKSPQRSLKRRMIILFSGFVAVLMLCVTLLFTWYMSVGLGEQVQQRLTSEINASQRLLEQRIDYLLENTERLTKNELVVNGLVDPEGRKNYLPKLVENFASGRDVISFSLVDYDGVPVFKTTDYVPDYNRSPELRRALAMTQRTLFIGESGRSMVIVSPIEYYATTQGAVVVEYDFPAVALREFSADSAAYFRLLAGAKDVVIHNYDARQSYIAERLGGNKQTTLLNELDLELEIGLPRSVYMAPVWEGVQLLLLFALLFIVIAVVVAARIGNSIAKPILTLFQRVNESATKQEVRCSPIGTGDELEALAKAFDQRTDVLLETQARLEEDVAERLKTQQEVDDVRHYLKNIIDSMPSMLVAVDVEGKVTHWNLVAERSSGISRDQAAGSSLVEMVPLLSGQESRVQVAIQQQQPEMIERLLHDEKGVQHYFDVMIYPLVGHSIEGAVIRVDDVTDRVRMEQLMAQTEKMMSVGGLAAGMAHELNNPLGGMLQGLQNIQRRFSAELKKNESVAATLDLDLHKVQKYMHLREIDHFMEGISEAGERAAGIVQNMLQFSRKSELVIVPSDIADLIDRTIDLASVDYDLKKSYDFRSIDIQRDYDPNLPLVPCVASEVQQVLLNLLRNAAQALHSVDELVDTSPQIIVRTQLHEDSAYIVVADNGPGMDEATRKRVFEPFFTTRPPGEGTGLGLSVSYFIICDELDGTLEVKSSPGEGAEFIIELPLKQQS